MTTPTIATSKEPAEKWALLPTNVDGEQDMIYARELNRFVFTNYLGLLCERPCEQGYFMQVAAIHNPDKPEKPMRFRARIEVKSLPQQTVRRMVITENMFLVLCGICTHGHTDFLDPAIARIEIMTGFHCFYPELLKQKANAKEHAITGEA